MNMTISEHLHKNRIGFQTSGGDLVIWCPFCEKTDVTGSRLLTFHIKPETGNGQCQMCLKRCEFENLAEKLHIKLKEPRPRIEPKETPEIKAEPVRPPVDTSQLKPLTSQELISILGLTIKKDEENKLITFLCELSAYTEGSQFNISFNAPSSTGKSYIPTEIARLFPEEDVVEIGYCSPTAFFHDVGEYDKENNRHLVDLSRKILIFLDQPHTQLLERLRPLLSHDKKEISLKITDKNQKAGLRTKNVLLRGYPAVIFCTAGLRIDEQEATRFLFLSPEKNQEKIREGIAATIRKEADSESFTSWLEENPERILLKERISAIKQEGIKEINIAGYEQVEQR